MLPELGIIFAGLIASSLIGIVYFLPIVLVISFKKKFQVSEKISHLMGIVWLSSVLLLASAEIFQVPSIMMVSTGVFVLVTIATATITALSFVSKRIIH